MATYGTFPTSPGESSPLDYISRAKARGRLVLATRRPWRKMLHFHSFSLPLGLGETYLRNRTNATYFAMNYAIIVLFIVFLSLLWHPISLIVFLATMFAWLFLYFLRDEPVFILGRTINDPFVLTALSILTLVFLLSTEATMNILISLLIGVVVVLIHAVFRKNDDLFLEEEAAWSFTEVLVNYQSGLIGKLSSKQWMSAKPADDVGSFDSLKGLRTEKDLAEDKSTVGDQVVTH